MTDVFISYSRQDADFGRKLYHALTQHKLQVWIDGDDTPESPAWWEKICKGIEQSDNFVLILSPDSLSSPICHLEMLHARERHKRIVPILHRDVDAALAFGSLAAHRLTQFEDKLLNQRDVIAIARANWQVVSNTPFFSFKQDDDFDTKLGDLQELLSTDDAYVHQHIAIAERAIEWDSNGRRSSSNLLRADTLLAAEAWLVTSTGKNPPPTKLQVEFVQASRRASMVQQRTTIGALILGLAVTLVLALSLFALLQQSRSEVGLANEQSTLLAARAFSAIAALELAEQRGTELAGQAGTATNALGLAEQQGTSIAEQAASATYALGLSEQRGIVGANRRCRPCHTSASCR
jgi:hypothetical protein